jgi:uncharacterized protein (TIRG00374 family)
VSLAVSFVFGYLALRNVRFGEAWHALGATDFWWLLPSLITLAAAVFVRALRWRYLFLPQSRPAVRDTTSALLIGYLFNSILPARAGEAARIVALHRRAGTSRAEATGTVVVERAYDVVSLVVLLLIASPWLPHVSWLRAAVVLALVTSVAMTLAVVLLGIWGEGAIRFLLMPLALLPFLTEEQVSRAAVRLEHGLAALTRPRLMLGAFFWTTLSWLLVALSSWFVIVAFGLHLSPVAGLLAVIAVNLAMVLPSSPAAAGVFEAATLVALGAYGVSSSVALSYAVVLHAINLLPFVVVGAVALHEHARMTRGTHAEWTDLDSATTSLALESGVTPEISAAVR